MKTTVNFIALALMCAFAKNSSAQSVIVQGGFNLSKRIDVHNGEDWGLKSVPGFHVGAYVDVPLNNKGLFVSPGLIYTTKGAKLEMEIFYWLGSDKIKSTITTNHVELPILFRRYFNIGNVKCYGGGGPFLSFMTHATEKWENDAFGESDSGKETIDLEGENRFETGGMLTASVELNQVQIGLHYSLGLLGFGGDYSPDEQFYSSVFSITAGYRFPLKK